MSKQALNIAILVVSDTRTLDTDTSGKQLQEMIEADGHYTSEKLIVKDDKFHIRAVVSQWIHQPDIQVVLVTGGTGYSPRDVTPDAIKPLLDQPIVGFGELFRQVSYTEIGSSTVQSRAMAGISNHTMIVAIPGSTGACKTAWHNILKEQLNSTHKPCNFVVLL